MAWGGEPSNANAKAQIASLLLELGRYDEARATLQSIGTGPAENPTVDSVLARYDELNGHLDEARRLIASGASIMDEDVNNPAYDRSWFHMRAAQQAFEAGDFESARREFGTSLADFPDNALALMWEARMYRAQGDWRKTLDAATKSAELYPLPQTFGYEADAQRTLGDASGARRTDALIAAEERLFNASGINDRLLAIYYAERGVHLDVAMMAAARDLEKRGNEVYADDTMAQVLEALGRWQPAYAYAMRAMRLGIEDPDVRYHVGVAALRTGHELQGRRLLESALQENPQFDPFEAPKARALLAGVEK